MLRNAASGAIPSLEPAADSPSAPPPSLFPIVRKALAPRIQDRHPSVAAFQQELREVLAHSESMAISRRAAAQLAALRQALPPDASGDETCALEKIDRNAAAVRHGLLSECVGGCRQAIELWTGNLEARQCLLDALVMQIRLAIAQDDLLLAGAQLRALEEMRPACPDPALAARMDDQRQTLSAQMERRQTRLDRAARQARRWRRASISLGLLLLAGLATIAAMSHRLRLRAIQNEKDMFSASIAGRAQMLDQFLAGIGQIAQVYQQAAEELMSCPLDRLPLRDPTPAGRDGFYYDEDFYLPETQPPEMRYSIRYKTRASMDFPTVVRSPRARQDANRAATEEAAARLGRLNTLFSRTHRGRDDIQWSLAGSEAGLLVGFPGFGRYRAKPDYDPTRRAWYLAGIRAADDLPVWGNPYADASTQQILMSCMCRIHIGGRNVGAVGLEITLNTLQKMLLDFALSVGGKRRGLLIKAFEESDPETGTTRTVHRVVVDTLYPRIASDWEARLEMTPVAQAGDEIAAFYREILEGKRRPGACHEIGRFWMVHMPVQKRTWTFIAILEHDP